MDLRSMCRLCSFKLHKPHNIFTTPGLFDKISKFTDIEIRTGDGLPCSICDLCDIKLQITDKFRRQVGKADKLIRACALKQTEELINSGILASEDTMLTPKTALQWQENGFRSQDSRPNGMNCERKQMSGGRPRRVRLSQGFKLTTKSNQNSARSLIYSYATARSLVASYKALIDRCQTCEFYEEFALPSSLVYSENENDERDERAGDCLVATRRRLREKRNLQESFGNEYSSRNITGTLVNEDLGIQDIIIQRIPADPLNLLKVKCIRPLVNDDAASFVSNSTDAFASRTASWRRDCQKYEAPGYRRSTEDLEDRSSTKCSSSKGNFSEQYRQSSSSISSTSTSKTSGQQARSDFGSSSCISSTLKNVDDASIPKDQQSAAQCPICDKICASVRGLKIHFKAHRSVKCQICNAPTKSKEKFKNHMQLHIKPIQSRAMIQRGVCKKGH